MTCNKNNLASARTIIKNGGKLENEVIEDNKIVQRYWITLKRDMQMVEIKLTIY